MAKSLGFGLENDGHEQLNNIFLRAGRLNPAIFYVRKNAVPVLFAKFSIACKISLC